MRRNPGGRNPGGRNPGGRNPGDVIIIEGHYLVLYITGRRIYILELSMSYINLNIPDGTRLFFNIL